jgi:signal transduction histidine kinase
VTSALGDAYHQRVGAPSLDADSRWTALRDRLLALLLRPTARPLGWGVVVAVSFITAETLMVLALKRVAPQNAFGAIFLFGVVVVSAGWSFGLGLATTLASALVYVDFHREAGDSLAPALFVFLPSALLVNIVAWQARLRAEEAEQRRREADLSAELARVMLRAANLGHALEGAGQLMAEVLGLRVAVLSLDVVAAEQHTSAIPLRDGASQVGTLLVPADLQIPARRRLRRMIPALEALLAAARDRERQLGEAQQLIETSHAEVSALARQQTALRRVATLVARGAVPADVYSAAVAELARGLAAEHVTLLRYDSNDHCTVLGVYQSQDRATFTIGEHLWLDGDSLSARIFRTARPARIDDYNCVESSIIARLRNLELRSGVGVPVIVDGQLRCALIIGSAQPTPMPRETEARIGDFADLVATAISNAETRAELTASRARIVAAADQARRGFERDLHDGAQQRIVALGLKLRAAQSSVPSDHNGLREQLTQVADGLGGLHTDLQELSRGLHPAILSKGGLGPAIKVLARRSAVPVQVDLEVDRRLPESIEVAAYYVVAEALTNATKHAQAAGVTVRVRVTSGDLHLSITDDGIGGAIPGHGSGLIGLKDRVEALSGRLHISSPAGGGTTLTATIPTGGK